MIVIDTNVVSEIVKQSPSPAVMPRFSTQKPHDLYTTTITQAEILYGIELLPQGRRRTTLQNAMARVFDETFAGRCCLSTRFAYAFAKIAAKRLSGRTSANWTHKSPESRYLGARLWLRAMWRISREPAWN